ncbi:multidrug resistance-associated protein 4-like [Trichogramma pretiosum]|uniref:multidrug resistance-associated protein 4-like n=1 Tax=Trichogramma pretiosum TaxID=7493 RepID=UPI000C7198D5|nr:multidrug resistance-associated protein 4-like [Trichogramma pretiosum]XP_023313500.1 multidrug resistance-associated protein 4-like [Trichogramma pretiosum]
MDSNVNESVPNPRESANTFSVLFWWWTIGIFKKGYSEILGFEDLYDPLTEDKSAKLGDRLEARWSADLQKARKTKKQPSLMKSVFHTFLHEYFVLGVIQFLNELILRLGTPMALGMLLKYFSVNPDEDKPTYTWALLFAGAISLSAFIQAITMNQAIFGAFHIGGRIRIAMCSLVYRKALRLSATALGESSPGKIVNLVATDVNRFDIVSVFIHHMWTAPIQTIIIAVILFQQAGWAGLAGLTFVVFVVPIQTYTGKLSSKYRGATALKTDERVRLMDEIISGVQVIKMYAWEKPFCKLIELARRLELKVIRKSSFIRGIYMTFNLFTTRMALFSTLLTLMLTDKKITASEIFVYSSYYNILSHTMSGMFIRGIAEIFECNVALRRLQRFLLFEEFQAGNVKNDTAFTRNCIESRQQMTTKDLPFIDDEVGFDERNGRDKERQNLVIVASDLLKRDGSNESLENTKITNQYNEECDSDQWSVKLSNLQAKWNLSSSEPTLNNVDMEVETGKLCAIIGQVGAGKSSLLSAILGEITLIHGNVRVKGSVSYASQEAWVFGATVRQNIIFGQAYDRQRYNRVVKACALLKDFKQFPQGDQTIVGERGSSLSGGQKARLNLARAVYRQADIYLMDDPLSAVDTHVGKHLFSECLMKYLRGKTRILVTHQLQYLPAGVDVIYLVDQGKVRRFSDYRELLREHPEYNSLIAEKDEANEASEEKSPENNMMMRSVSQSSIRSHSSALDSDNEDDPEDPEKTMQYLEGSSRGIVKGDLLIAYFREGSNLFVGAIILFLFIVTQLMASGCDFFVPILTTAEESRAYYKFIHENNISESEANRTSSIIDEASIWSRDNYIYLYTFLVLAVFCIGMLRSIIFYVGCMTCSQRLHDLAFSALIRASMRFFDQNPSGRILNRFSKDMSAIDELLPKTMLDSGQIIFQVAGALIVSCMVNYYFLVPIVVIGVLFYFIRRVFLKTSKNIKRLEGMTRSPVFTHLTATLNGLTTIRACNAHEVLKKEFDNFQDTNTSAWYLAITTSTAFGFSLDLFCFIFTALVTFSFLLIQTQIPAGSVGLAITQVMATTGMIQWGMRQSAEVANQLMSVERVLEYAFLSPEPNLQDKGLSSKQEKKKKKPQEEQELKPVPADWPQAGGVRFDNVFLQYADNDPPVIKELTMTINPTEKVGIVGRTGAGKSSLIAALFRLAKIEGVIEIDGIDTGKISLEDLRKNISIIPQDPVLFSGTLRRNLDPFNEFSDEQLWNVLDEVELKDAVKQTNNGLENRVHDRGSNYSVGQRQLICLARAILRNNRVLMLDEATANVDPQTDALIQKTIRTKFAPCTVLTVAHRLNTIMDSNKVLVMDKGRLVEFDHPHILLQDKFGEFTSLVKETGDAMYEQLCKVAKESYEREYASVRLNSLTY